MIEKQGSDKDYTFDYARGKKIWGNGLCGDQYYYRYLLDGESTTSWKCRYPFICPQYIILDIEDGYTVNQLIIKEPAKKIGSLKKFSVSVSLDEATWEDINFNESRKKDGVIVCDFEESKVRYLRLNLLEFDEKELSLVALEVYHTKDMKAFPVPELPHQCTYQPELLRSKIVYEGKDGFLQYHPYDELGNCIPDFSNVGYRGGADIPEDIPVKVVLEPQQTEEWDTLRIQQAVDRVSELPIGENGYRGAILLKKGQYAVNQTIFVRASGVVLMGEGNGENDTVIYADYGKKIPFISIEGTDDMTELPGSRKKILEDFIPVGSHSFTLEDVSGYQVGDDVVLHIKKNQNWVDTLQMGKDFLDESTDELIAELNADGAIICAKEKS